MKLESVMTPCPYKISADKSISEALALMQMRGIRHLPVIDGDELLGVISERDLNIGGLNIEHTGKDLCVGDLCTGEPVILGTDATVSEVAAEMEAHKVDYILAADSDGNLVGIFTTTDALKLIRRGL